MLYRQDFPLATPNLSAFGYAKVTCILNLNSYFYKNENSFNNKLHVFVLYTTHADPHTAL